jgi:Na+-transporting NADH:ubiquinone oxidoreductase subunit NqrB
MGWTPGWGSLWMVHPFVLAPNFVSATPLMDILFHILGRNEVSTRWSSFLIFLCFGSCIFGILGFWATIHLSVSAYEVTSFVIELFHSG